MELTVDETIDSVLVTLAGRFDAFETEAFRTATAGHLSAARPVVVDLAEVNFIDSSGLAELVRCMKRCREAGGDLILTRPSEPVSVILELTRLDIAFTIDRDGGSP